MVKLLQTGKTVVSCHCCGTKRALC